MSEAPLTRKLVFCALVAILVALFAAVPHQGFSFACSSNQCSMSASTSMMGLVAPGILIAFIVFHPQETGTPKHVEPIKIWERFTAFLIDLLVVFSVSVPIATLPILLAEAGATGNFQWSFERDFSRPTDAALAFPGVLWMFVALVGYFYIHPVIGRQTIGQYLLGFRVEAVPGAGKKPSFGLNILLGYIGLCVWPVSLYLAAKRQDKTCWWNLRTRTRLVRSL